MVHALVGALGWFMLLFGAFGVVHALVRGIGVVHALDFYFFLKQRNVL